MPINLPSKQRACSIHNCTQRIYCPWCLAYRCCWCNDTHYTSYYFHSTLPFQNNKQNGIHNFYCKLCMSSSLRSFLPNMQSVGNIIHYIKGHTIIIFDTFKCTKFSIKVGGFLNYYAESISFGSRIFIMGGYLTDGVLEYNIGTGSLLKKTAMRIPKYCHSLCICLGNIYSIGGKGSTMELADSEKYNVQNNKWVQLPDLNTPRCKCTTFAFNKEYIYALCGSLIQSKNINFLERISIIQHLKWEIIVMQNRFAENTKMNGIQINSKNVLLFVEGDITKLEQSYILCINGNNIKLIKNSKLTKADLHRRALPMHGKVYGIDEHRNIHIFSKSKWEVVTN